MENRGSMSQAVAYIPAASEPQPQQVQQQQVQSSAQMTGPSVLSRVIRTAWTIVCFLVFCGFSFFLGWHMKGWHFSAYYEAPNASYVGAKPVAEVPNNGNAG